MGKIFDWNQDLNPYEENIFSKYGIPLHLPGSPQEKSRLQARIRNARLDARQQERLRDPNLRMVEELLAHPTPRVNQQPVEEYLRFFDPLPLSPGLLSEGEVVLQGMGQLYVCPPQGCAPEPPPGDIVCPAIKEQEWEHAVPFDR